MLESTVTLGGRTFGFVDYDRTTVIHAHYIERIMRHAGLDTVLPGEDEPDNVYLLRLQSKLVDTLELPALLAGMLIEVPKSEADWSIEEAARQRQFIEGLTSPKDKAAVHKLGYEAVLTFFRDGLASAKRSLNSSELSPPQTVPSRARADEKTGAH